MPITPENHGEIRQAELQPCLLCGEGMMAGGFINFYRVRLQQFIVNLPAVQRQHGMEMMMGGAAPLAQIMGPAEPMALGPSPADGALICGECGTDPANGILTLLAGFEEKDPGG